MEGALSRRHASVPEVLEEEREESRHDGCREGRVGPVVHRPAEDWAAREDAPLHAGLAGHAASSRVSWKLMSGHRSIVNCRFTRDGARYTSAPLWSKAR